MKEKLFRQPHLLFGLRADFWIDSCFLIWNDETANVTRRLMLAVCIIPRVKDIGGAWMIHRVIPSRHHGNGCEFIKAFMSLHSPALWGGKNNRIKRLAQSIGLLLSMIHNFPLSPLQTPLPLHPAFPPCLFFFFLFLFVSFCFFFFLSLKKKKERNSISSLILLLCTPHYQRHITDCFIPLGSSACHQTTPIAGLKPVF